MIEVNIPKSDEHFLDQRSTSCSTIAFPKLLNVAINIHDKIKHANYIGKVTGIGTRGARLDILDEHSAGFRSIGFPQFEPCVIATGREKKCPPDVCEVRWQRTEKGVAG